MKIEELLARQEGKTLEFKQDLSSHKNIIKTITAFANTAGGTLLIGVENKTKAIIGLNDPLEGEEQLASLIADSIEPRLVPSIDIINWQGRTLLAVEVFPSSLRPHNVKTLGPENGTFVRIGSTNRQADGPLREELARWAKHHSFDEEPMPENNPEAIDFGVASGLFSGLREWNNNTMESLRLVTKHQGRMVPTVGGILLFSDAREKLFPDAWIQCGRFKGNDKVDLLDQLDIKNHLPLALSDAFDFIKKHTSIAAEFGELQRTDRASIPLKAAREAISNALVHTDYSQRGAPIRVSVFDDRLEIENPGLLVGGLTIEDVRSGVSKLRNRVIGRVFKELNLIEQWGSGFQRMAASCREVGLPEPKLEEVAFRFKITFSLVKDVTKEVLDDKDQRIIALIKESVADGGATTKYLSEQIGLSTRAISERLTKLTEAGYIVVIQKNRYDPKKRYLPAQEG